MPPPAGGSCEFTPLNCEFTACHRQKMMEIFFNSQISFLMKMMKFFFDSQISSHERTIKEASCVTTLISFSTIGRCIMINYEIAFFGHCRFLRLISATAILLVDSRKTCYVTMLTDRLCISLGPAPRALGTRSVVPSSRSPTRSFSTARWCRIFCARASRGGSGGVPNRAFNKPLRPEKPPPASQRSRLKRPAQRQA